MLVFCTSASSYPDCSTFDQHTDNMLGKSAKDDLSSWALVTKMGEPHGVLIVVVIWGGNQQIGYLNLPAPILCLSNK